MSSVKCFFLASSLLLSAATVSSAADMCRLDDPEKEKLRQSLVRGFNLVGWLDRLRSRPPKDDVLEKLRVTGFTHVRLPVNPTLLIPAFASKRIIEAQRKKLDVAVNRLISAGFAVSIDIHPDSRFSELHRDSPEAGFRHLDELWAQLAARFATTPVDRVYFEILNEPPVSGAIWRDQAERLVRTIRKFAPKHTIVYGAAEWQRIEALIAQPPLKDDNVVYAVHYYDPMVFTHQGANWSGTSPYRMARGIPFPIKTGDRAVQRLADQIMDRATKEGLSRLVSDGFGEDAIAHAFSPLHEWARQFGVVVNINEFGVFDAAASPEDRARWIRSVRSVAEHYCFGWTHWEFNDGFGMMRASEDGLELDPAIGAALLGPQ